MKTGFLVYKEQEKEGVKLRERKGLEKTSVIIAGASFIFGLIFLSYNVTGNVIGISNISGNYIGVIFMAISIISIFMYSRERQINEPTTMRVYDSRNDLIQALKNLDWKPQEINNALRHEDAHYREAVRRGYKPKYCVGVNEDIGANKYRAGIVLDREASREDLTAILSAPVELSPSDKQHLKSLKSKNQKNRILN